MGAYDVRSSKPRRIIQDCPALPAQAAGCVTTFKGALIFCGAGAAVLMNLHAARLLSLSRVSQKPVAGSAAFQAAGVGKMG